MGKGNRLKGAEKSKTITVRVPQRLKEQYKDEVDSMSGDLKEHIKRRVEEGDDWIEPPENDMLRKGWRAMRRAAGPDGTIPTSVAKSRISEAARVKPEDAIRCVIRPLDDLGYVRVRRMGELEVLGA
jgi:hypothetical protein